MTSPDTGTRVDTVDVVITDCDHESVDLERGAIQAAGFTARLENCVTQDDILAVAGDASVLITQYAPVDRRVLESLPACRGVVRYGVGVDNIDVAAANDLGIAVANVPDYGVDEVATHAVALALALVRGLPSLTSDVDDGGWDYQRAIPLYRPSTLTVGVIGCGRIGGRAAEMLRAIGFSLLIADPRMDPDLARRLGAEVVDVPELLSRSDLVTVHVPLAADTRNLIDRDALRTMRPGSYLVNTARGGIVDSEAVLDALDSGRLAGVGLDVLETEPPEASDRLVRHPNSIITPHAAWYSEQAFAALKSGVAQEAIRLLTGEPIRNPIVEGTPVGST